MNPYKGNGKPFVYVYFPPDEKERALSILEKFVQKNGNVSFWWSEKPLKKPEKVIDAAFSVIAFFKQAQINDKDFQNVIDAAVRCEKKILPIHLEETEYNTPWSRLALGSKQGIIRSAYKDDEQLLEKMTGAETFVDMKVTARQKKNRRSQLLRIIGGLLASALGIVGVLFFTGVIGFDPGDEEQVIELPAFGISGTQEELDKITTLCIYCDEAPKYELDEEIMPLPWGDFNDPKQMLESNTLELNGNIVSRGKMTDLNGLEFLRNLETLELKGQRISDISPIFKLKKLKYLSLRYNFIDSVEGIESMENLEAVELSANRLTDVSSLFRCPKLSDVTLDYNLELCDLGCDYAPNISNLSIVHTKVEKVPIIGVGLEEVIFRSCESNVTDYSFLSKVASFDGLSISGHVKATLLPVLKDKTINFILWEQSDLESMQELADTGVVFTSDYAGMVLNHSDLKTLEGVENIRGEIKKLNFVQDEMLTDLSPIQNLPSLNYLVYDTRYLQSDFNVEEYCQEKNIDYEAVDNDDYGWIW